MKHNKEDLVFIKETTRSGHVRIQVVPSAYAEQRSYPSKNRLVVCTVWSKYEWLERADVPLIVLESLTLIGEERYITTNHIDHIELHKEVTGKDYDHLMALFTVHPVKVSICGISVFLQSDPREVEVPDYFCMDQNTGRISLHSPGFVWTAEQLKKYWEDSRQYMWNKVQKNLDLLSVVEDKENS